MANAVTTQVLVDGPRNVIIKVDGYLDTSDYPATAIADPATLSFVDNGNTYKASQLRIDRIIYAIDEGLVVTLLWDATTPVRIVDLARSGHMEFQKGQGLQNNAGAGKTGKILLSTEGWGSGIKEFTLYLELVKQ